MRSSTISSAPTPSTRWIIDPIDGTKNYVRGVPIWATLIGLEHAGELVVGVVSAPALHMRWWAARGMGAFRNGEAIHVSSVAALDDAQLSFAWDTFAYTDGRAPAPAPRRGGAELTSRERRERALLAMCIALPDEGREYLGRLTEAHLSPSGAAAAAWLRENLDDPASNLPHDDDQLAGLIAELVILAHDEPASPESMELNYLLLEQRRLEAEIAAAGERDDYEQRAALSRERAALVERIARTERVG